jgi:3-hydroxyacyl-[acyl-carrier-protein] dehydratase
MLRGPKNSRKCEAIFGKLSANTTEASGLVKPVGFIPRSKCREVGYMENEASTRTLETADITRVMKLLPHRYPFLMIDRIIDIDGDKSAIGIKNVTVSEPFFQGHFPSFPVMPGVLLVEAIAQTAGAICVAKMGETYQPQLVYFMTIEKAKFRRPVVPGDTVHFHVQKIRNRGPVWRFAGEAKVEGMVVAEAHVSAMIADPEEN